MFRVIINAAFIASLAWGGVSAAQGPPAGPPPPLRLRAGTFDPTVEDGSRAVKSLPGSWQGRPALDDLVVVQFIGEPRAGWLDDLRSRGATLFDYLPENAYLARLLSSARADVAARPFVRAVVPYLPAFRVDPSLAARASAPATEEVGTRLLITATPDRVASELASDLVRAMPSAEVVEASSHVRATLVTIQLSMAPNTEDLARLVSLGDVLWVEELLPISLHNAAMKPVLQTGGGGLRLFQMGLTGSGQLIGVGDSGLDTGHCFFADASETVAFELIDPGSPPAVPATNPAHRKILAYQYHSASSSTDEAGHGTHVSGTAAGDDLANLASGTDPGLDPFDGMAPGARLVFQDIQGGGGNFLDVPSNLYGFYAAAYNAGARIHTNSWGSATNSYTSFSSQVDGFTWDHPDMLFLYSAGNDGPNSGTVGSPSTAKNSIAVGMVETPISGDPNNLEAASSNGPTSDGRLKPDLVNVGGSPITSAANGTVCGTINFGGTSMATPGVAGAAALVRQYLVDGFHPHGYAASGGTVAASAALTKAILVNSAVNIDGNNVDGPIPDHSQGWGRVTLDDALFFVGDDLRLELLRDDNVQSAADGFAAGATVADVFTVENCRTDVPLKVTLVWSEPPVAATSGQAWVNNLNLEVLAPDATIYLGNVFSSGVSATGGIADDRNNVEQVLIAAGNVQSGQYTVRVVPASVAIGPQPYALIATGDVSANPAASLKATGVSILGGCDNDEFLDENETLTITYTLENQGCATSQPLTANLMADTTLPVSVQPADVALSALPVGVPIAVMFDVSMGATGGGCGGTVPLSLVLGDANGRRWQAGNTLALQLDPAVGSRASGEDAESGDASVARDAAWQIAACAVSGGSSSWHMGQSDCTGIPQDSQAHVVEFELALTDGEQLSSASFMHAFDGYANASLSDSVHFEIDHDLDGTFDTVRSWTDSTAPKTMVSTGQLDLTAFKSGAAATPHFRFRFQSGANWVGGPNNASGWNVDDLSVQIDIIGTCDANSMLQPPPDVGNSLQVAGTAASTDLSWSATAGSETYLVRRSTSLDLAGAVEFAAIEPAYTDTETPAAAQTYYYDVIALSSCGVTSED